MVDAASKAFFQAISQNSTIKRLASRYGMAGSRGFARRFIAGETLEDAIVAARDIAAHGLHLTLDHLGESVTTVAAAEAATREYLEIIEAIHAAGVEKNLSLKLTQLGLDIDSAACADNLRLILAAADRCRFFVRIDMESSRHTDVTLQVFETIWKEGMRNVGVVLQSCLYRTERDFERVNALGARIRLVKGAYLEPRSVAYQSKADVDAAFLRVAKRLLTDGTYPAIATHDVKILDEVRRFAAARAIAPDRYEFQMLYGIRRDLQAALAGQGLRVRVYVPFGREWFPYFMRRLGERPANVAFVLRNLIADTALGQGSGRAEGS